jgi:hypothetical protein
MDQLVDGVELPSPSTLAVTVTEKKKDKQSKDSLPRSILIGANGSKSVKKVV